MKRTGRQRGFTLVEVMIAGLLTTGLVLVALSLLATSMQVNQELEGRLRLSAQARSVFAVLANGAVIAGETGTDGTAVAPGLRGLGGKIETGTRNALRLEFVANGLTVRGDTLSDVTITCADLADPLPDCTGPGATVVMRGWIASDLKQKTNQRSVGERTVETGFTLADPWLIRRDGPENSAAIEEYETIFVLNDTEVF